MKPRFKVGDIVHIVDEPVELPSSWVSDMDWYCGKEVVIRDASMHDSCLTGKYYVELAETGENIGWMWNDEAFQEFYGDPVAEDDLLKLLNG